MIENQVVTLFRLDHLESKLVCKGTVPAWVYRKSGIRNQGNGVYSDERFDVRIAKKHIDDIETGDFIFFGRAESSCAHLSECHRVDVVSLNNFGLCPHWHLVSKYKSI